MKSVARASAVSKRCCTIANPAPTFPLAVKLYGAKRSFGHGAPEMPPKFRREMHWIQHRFVLEVALCLWRGGVRAGITDGAWLRSWEAYSMPCCRGRVES